MIATLKSKGSIRATVNGHALTWSDGHLALEKPDAATDQAVSMIFMHGHRAYNPAAGGPYVGFDSTNPVHVLDALQRLEQWGHKIKVTQASYERGARPSYPGGFDTRNEADWRALGGPPHLDPFPVDEDDDEFEKSFDDDDDDEEDELEKGVAGHKYIRRMPTGNPKKPWRYFYRITGEHEPGAKASEPEKAPTFAEGASFQLHSGDKDKPVKGHFSITKVDGAKVTMRHDESGEVHTFDAEHLRDLLQREKVKPTGKAKGQAPPAASVELGIKPAHQKKIDALVEELKGIKSIEEAFEGADSDETGAHHNWEKAWISESTPEGELIGKIARGRASTAEKKAFAEHLGGASVDVVERMAMRQYAATQAAFKTAGVTHVRLHRGIVGDQAKELRAGAHEPTELRTRSLSSWTGDEAWGDDFGSQYGMRGVVVVADVPVESIISWHEHSEALQVSGEAEALVMNRHTIKLPVGAVRDAKPDEDFEEDAERASRFKPKYARDSEHEQDEKDEKEKAGKKEAKKEEKAREAAEQVERNARHEKQKIEDEAARVKRAEEAKKREAEEAAEVPYYDQPENREAKVKELLEAPARKGPIPGYTPPKFSQKWQTLLKVDEHGNALPDHPFEKKK